jgi:hypothetical protein
MAVTALRAVLVFLGGFGMGGPVARMIQNRRERF